MTRRADPPELPPADLAGVDPRRPRHANVLNGALGYNVRRAARLEQGRARNAAALALLGAGEKVAA